MREHHAYLGADARPRRATATALRRRAQQQPAPPARRDGRRRWRAGGHHAAHARRCRGWSRRAALAPRAPRVRRGQRRTRPTAWAARRRRATVDPQRRRHRPRGARARAGRPRSGRAGWCPRRRRTWRSTPRARPACRSSRRAAHDPAYFDARDRAAARRRRRATSATSTTARSSTLVGRAAVALVTPALGRALRPGRRRGDGLRHPGGGVRPRRRCRRSSTRGRGRLAAPGDVDALARRSRGRHRARPRRRAAPRRASLLGSTDGRRLRGRSTGSLLVDGARGVIGYYVHHHGQRPPAPGPGDRGRRSSRPGHRAVVASRAGGLDRRRGSSCRATTSGEPPADADAPAAGCTGCRCGDHGPAATGWPRLSAWIARRRGPRVIVVDVSVEVALLARLHGVPVVSVVLPGERDDAAHRLGLDVCRRRSSRPGRRRPTGMMRRPRARTAGRGCTASERSPASRARPTSAPAGDAADAPRRCSCSAAPAAAPSTPRRSRRRRRRRPAGTWTVLGSRAAAGSRTRGR